MSGAAQGTPRRGLVCGAGGVLGFAWEVGALTAVSEHLQWDPRDADVLVGTSAGSVMAALLGCGVPVEDLLSHQRGMELPPDRVIAYDYERDADGPLPGRPRLRPGSPGLLLRSARRPLAVRPMALAAAALPEGRQPLDSVGRIVRGVLEDPGGWAPHPRTWVVAMDYVSGRRAVFGRTGEVPAPLTAAVTASCSIPGWYAPVRIGGRRYVDGGVLSSTSADLVAGLGLDELVVVAPMASFDYDRPAHWAVRAERRLRRWSTRSFVRELRAVKATGTRVTVLTPGPDDLRAMGANLMDPRRRERVLETSVATARATLAARAARESRRRTDRAGPPTSSGPTAPQPAA